MFLENKRSLYRSQHFKNKYIYIYICIYVCMYVSIRRSTSPDRRASSSHEFLGPPPVLKSTGAGGTALTHGCPHRCLVSSGGTCMYTYIYIYILSVSLSARSLAAKARRPQGLRVLASERARQSLRRCLRLLLAASDVPRRPLPRPPSLFAPCSHTCLFSCFLSAVRQVDPSYQHPTHPPWDISS